MWNFLSRVFGRRRETKGASIDSVFRALDEGESARPAPTLVCRQCGLKYANTGTYLQGARCPACHPQG